MNVSSRSGLSSKFIRLNVLLEKCSRYFTSMTLEKVVHMEVVVFYPNTIYYIMLMAYTCVVFNLSPQTFIISHNATEHLVRIH